MISSITTVSGSEKLEKEVVELSKKKLLIFDHLKAMKGLPP